MKKTLTIMLSLALSLSALAQDLQSQAWPAKWISVPGASELDYGVYYFRKDVDLMKDGLSVSGAGSRRCISFWILGTIGANDNA